MTSRVVDKSTKNLYRVAGFYQWMEVINDADKGHPAFKMYRRSKQRLVNLSRYVRLDARSRVADFGCGNGIWGDQICRRVKSYLGVDFSPEFIELAKKRHALLGITNSRFVCDDIVKFCAAHRAEFDQGFALDFCEHLSDQEFHSIFGAIRRTLRPGGELYIHTPNGDYFLERLKARGLMKQVTGHIGIRNKNNYWAMLRALGFKNITAFYLPHHVRPLAAWHFLGSLPVVGKFGRARLLIRCDK